MVTIENVFKMWDKKHPNMQIDVQGYGKRKNEKIREGNMHGRRNRELVIKLSEKFAFDYWDNRTCYVFDFKYDKLDELIEIYISFQRRIMEHPNTESLYEELKSIKEKRGLDDFNLSQGKINPNHIVLGRKLDLNLSAESICDCMEKFIYSTKDDIYNFLIKEQWQEKEVNTEQEQIIIEDEQHSKREKTSTTLKEQKPEIKLNQQQEEVINRILEKHNVTVDEQVRICKEIYLLTEYFSERLLVRNTNKLKISHYLKKSIATKLLIASETNEYDEFRLYDIFTMNDPSEGKILLNFLLKTEYEDKPELKLPENLPFIACFSLEADSLNQFRLYGKEDDKESTGVSILFKPSFFENFKLYRCVYINYKGKLKVSLSKDEDDDDDDEANKFQEEIGKNFEKLKELCEKLKLDGTKININKLLADLFIEIRYLFKNSSFEEERECRMIVWKNKRDESIKVDGNRLYIKAGEIKRHIDKIYFAPLAEGMEAFEIKSRLECIRSEHKFRK